MTFKYGVKVQISDDAKDSPLSDIKKTSEGNRIVRAKTSSQLVDLMKKEQEELEQEDKQEIENFVSQLKIGDGIHTKDGTAFRQRRLSVASKTVQDNAPVEAPQPAEKPFKSRTVIFSSSEIGVLQEKQPPFPPEVLGTYSCHGIEPAEDEEDGIHEKINQDRGCIAYPYNHRKDEALLMVLDGHGEQGDKVSEFVMRQVGVTYSSFICTFLSEFYIRLLNNGSALHLDCSVAGKRPVAR